MKKIFLSIFAMTLLMGQAMAGDFVMPLKVKELSCMGTDFQLHLTSDGVRSEVLYGTPSTAEETHLQLETTLNLVSEGYYYIQLFSEAPKFLLLDLHADSDADYREIHSGTYPASKVFELTGTVITQTEESTVSCKALFTN